jgi:hypothetical protein
LVPLKNSSIVRDHDGRAMKKHERQNRIQHLHVKRENEKLIIYMHDCTHDCLYNRANRTALPKNRLDEPIKFAKWRSKSEME